MQQELKFIKEMILYNSYGEEDAKEHMGNARFASKKKKKHTTAGIRWWSPTQLLTGRRVA